MTAVTALPEAAETTVTYDDLMRTATLTLPFEMGFVKETQVPYSVEITEYILSEEFAFATLSETFTVTVPYVPIESNFVVVIEEEEPEEVVEEPVPEEEPEEEEEPVEEEEEEEEDEEPEFVSVFTWTPPKPRK